MKREIKFRAWDWYNKVSKIYTLKQLADEDKFNYDTEFEAIQSGFDNWKWMQYTGEKDKYAQEIFEGDIVQINGEKIMLVVYENGCFRTPYNDSNYRLGGWKQESIEVIGNMYENPELISCLTPSA